MNLFFHRAIIGQKSASKFIPGCDTKYPESKAIDINEDGTNSKTQLQFVNLAYQLEQHSSYQSMREKIWKKVWNFSPSFFVLCLAKFTHSATNKPLDQWDQVYYIGDCSTCKWAAQVETSPKSFLDDIQSGRFSSAIQSESENCCFHLGLSQILGYYWWTCCKFLVKFLNICSAQRV